MIWPFKRDPLVSDADLLVGAVNTLAISMFPKFVDEFAFIPNDERGQRYGISSLQLPEYLSR
jgi:hypothetical protein